MSKWREMVREKEPHLIEVADRSLMVRTRRDFLIAGAGAIVAASGFLWTLPDDTVHNLFGRPVGPGDPVKEAILNRAIDLDDDVATALYSDGRLVPTYSISAAQRILRNNYNGLTPDLDTYIDTWTLTLTGLASWAPVHLNAADINRLIDRFGYHEQVTRLCCVEGWSMIAGWGGLRFADLLTAYPPAPGSRWAQLRSEVNLDGDGNPDPYFVSIDLPTAIHPQTLLATHQNSPTLKIIPLKVENGAPMRLLAPMKLGLKNIKAITSIAYSASEPPDYWNERGYSKYDGL